MPADDWELWTANDAYRLRAFLNNTNLRDVLDILVRMRDDAVAKLVNATRKPQHRPPGETLVWPICLSRSVLVRAVQAYPFHRHA